MFRLFLVVLAAALIAGGVAYYNGWLNDYVGTVDIGPQALGADPQKSPTQLGEMLYLVETLQPLAAQQRMKAELPLDLCHAVVPLSGRQEVSSPRDGKVLFLGSFVPENVKIPSGPRPVQQVKVFDGVDFKDSWFYPLREQDFVEKGQVLVVIDPSIANHEVQSKHVKVLAAKAEYDATKAIVYESGRRLDKLESLRSLPGGDKFVTDQELGEARVAVAKYTGDEIIKRQGIQVATFELNQATLVQYQHYLRCELDGKSIVKKIYRAAGEGVKPQEPVLQLWNVSQLSIEGSVDSQYFRTLQDNKNAPCYLVPTVEMAPKLEQMKAHTGEVNSVAVCSDGKFFVSGSEDHKVFVWQRDNPRSVQMLRMQTPARTVACSPKERSALIGCSDGSLTYVDLSDVDKPKQFEFKEKHRGSITALAFSPDGTHIASGGEDSAIMIWKSSGELLYTLDAGNGAEDPHEGTISSLHFTPQCTLISAARDNTLRVWQLHKKGAKRLGPAIANRSGTVHDLGVSADGRFMLFDRGKTLQILNTADGAPVYTLDNLTGTNPFDTLAMFSPDGQMLLTGGAGEGRLHLWKTPTNTDRGYQLREFVTKERAAITCAAFAPASHGFAVSGSKDGTVNLWNLPSRETVDTHLIRKGADGKDLRLDLVESDLNAGKTRVAVNFKNPQDKEGRLLLSPGQRVTLVVELIR